jgi:predicted nucleotidyltransferase
MATNYWTVTDESKVEESKLPMGRLRSTLEEQPVQLAVLFGSHARGRSHAGSDVDIAVEFDGIRPDDDEYNETLFGLVAELSRTLDTDDVDVVDIHTLGPDVASAVFENGTVLLGDEARFQELGEELTRGRDDQPPAERFDDALAKIDEHLA